MCGLGFACIAVYDLKSFSKGSAGLKANRHNVLFSKRIRVCSNDDKK